MLQLDPPGQCHPDVHPKFLLSTQKWAGKKQKRSKTAKSSQKLILLVKIRPLENVFFAFSPVHLVGPWKTTFGGWWPFVETTFGGRRPSVEDSLRWKTTIGGRWRFVEDYLWWKRPSVEYDLQWKTTFDWGRPLVEEDLVEDTLQWKTTYMLVPCMLPNLLCGIFAF